MNRTEGKTRHDATAWRKRTKQQASAMEDCYQQALYCDEDDRDVYSRDYLNAAVAFHADPSARNWIALERTMAAWQAARQPED